MVYPVHTPPICACWVEAALRSRKPPAPRCRGSYQAEATTAHSDELVGCTRFLDLDLHNRTTEIGNTWLTEALIAARASTPKPSCCNSRFAFELHPRQPALNRVRASSSCPRPSQHQRSQAAIKIAGPRRQQCYQREGTFRNHLRHARRQPARQTQPGTASSEKENGPIRERDARTVLTRQARSLRLTPFRSETAGGNILRVPAWHERLCAPNRRRPNHHQLLFHSATVRFNCPHAA